MDSSFIYFPELRGRVYISFAPVPLPDTPFLFHSLKILAPLQNHTVRQDLSTDFLVFPCCPLKTFGCLIHPALISTAEYLQEPSARGRALSLFLSLSLSALVYPDSQPHLFNQVSTQVRSEASPHFPLKLQLETLSAQKACEIIRLT